VTEITVAVLDVDEGEAGLVRLLRRGDDAIDEPIHVVVTQCRHAARKAAIEERVSVGDTGLAAPLHVGLRVAARVGELQADVEVAVGVGAERFLV
jgi:hypothetical protein